ncbi:hypothetical protein LCGC14_0729460 [marine sediment metagenome]|uniref:Uncharacterized protein n=1 Tax=marine sediment metagenome TaxID=412755 RepID=A0A0F9QE70_9ZZZZ
MIELLKITALAILLFFSIEKEPTARAEIDYPFLRDIICDEVETPGEPIPDFSVGKVRNQKGGLPWGRCQIKYWTAVREGFSISRNPGDLFKKSVNKEYSLKILKGCSRDLLRRDYPITVRTVSHCYGSGYYRRHPKSGYSKTVTGFYNQSFFERQVKIRNQILQMSRTNFFAAIRILNSEPFSPKERYSYLKDIIRRIKIFLEKYSIEKNELLWEI